MSENEILVVQNTVSLNHWDMARFWNINIMASHRGSDYTMYETRWGHQLLAFLFICVVHHNDCVFFLGSLGTPRFPPVMTTSSNVAGEWFGAGAMKIWRRLGLSWRSKPTVRNNANFGIQEGMTQDGKSVFFLRDANLGTVFTSCQGTLFPILAVCCFDLESQWQRSAKIGKLMFLHIPKLFCSGNVFEVLRFIECFLFRKIAWRRWSGYRTNTFHVMTLLFDVFG